MLAIFCLIIIGCSPSPKNEAFHVVDKYLEVSANLQMDEVLHLLTGEALLETQANMAYVTESQQVTINKKQFNQITENLVEVTVDYTTSTAQFNNRKANLFKLKRTGQQWKIYKIENTNYLHNDLKSSTVSSNAKHVAKEYIELSKPGKDKHNTKYLAGELLSASMAAQRLPRNENEAKFNLMDETVTDIKCLGASNDYAILEVHSMVNGNGVSYSVETIMHMVTVNEDWKIVKMDIAEIREGADK